MFCILLEVILVLIPLQDLIYFCQQGEMILMHSIKQTNADAPSLTLSY